MGFPHMIIEHDEFKTVHCHEVTNQNIPNIFAMYILLLKLFIFLCSFPFEVAVPDK